MKLNRDSMTQEILKELVDYDPDTGVMVMKKRSYKYFKSNKWGDYWNRRYAGNIMNHDDDTGHYDTSLLGVRYKVHRLAWMYIYGEMPEIIDHINHNGFDNRISNIRNTDFVGNSRNKGAVHSKSGYIGVYKRNDYKDKWRVQIRVNDKLINVGTFNSIEEAVDARKLANKKYGFHENHGNNNQNLKN